MVANAVYPSRAAERVLFRELFRNPADVARNGGTIVGSPEIKDGVVLDGVADALLYEFEAPYISVPELSIVAEFMPNTAWDDGVDTFIFDTQSSARYSIRKTSSDVLRIYLGDVIIQSIGGATFGPYWNVGERNRIVVSSNGSSTDVWLNGVHILVADATAWPVLFPTDLWIGVDYGSSLFLNGEIYRLDFQRGLLTQADVDAMESGRLWSYPNRASVWLDMAVATARDGTTELLADNKMEAVGVADWAVGADAGLTKETYSPYEGSQVLRVTQGASVFAYAAQTILTAGTTYHVTGRMRGDGVNALPRIRVGGTYGTPGTTSTDWQEINEYLTATSAEFRLYQYTVLAGHCDFDDFRVRPVLAQTLDKSPYGHVCLLGDGFTAADIPDFLNPGFELDGVNQYMQIVQAGSVYASAAGVGIAACFRPDFFPNDGVNHYLYDSTSTDRYYALKQSTGTLLIVAGGTTIASIAQATYEPHWLVDSLNVLVVFGVSGNMNATLNGQAILTNDTSPWTPASPTEIFIGSRFGGVSLFSGTYCGFYAWPEGLSPLQVRDFTISQGVHT